MILVLHYQKNDKKKWLSLIQCDECKKNRISDTSNFQKKINKNKDKHLCKSCRQRGDKNHQFGKRKSEEFKLKMSGRVSGSGNPMFGVKRPEIIEKLRQANLGRTFSEERRKQMSESFKGRFAKEKHPQYGKIGPLSPTWNPNLTEEDRGDRRLNYKYKEWVLAIFKIHNYTCNICKECGCELNAHHLDGWNWCKEKRYDIANGDCLCEYCHNLFHDIHGRGNNTKEQFNQFKSTIFNGYC